MRRVASGEALGAAFEAGTRIGELDAGDVDPGHPKLGDIEQGG